MASAPGRKKTSRRKKAASSRRRRSVSLADVARRAGVSVKTVSNILNHTNKEIWPSTIKRAERVRRIAREMGYRRNTGAKAVRTGELNAVALAFRQSRNPFLPTALLRALAEEAASNDLTLHLAGLPRSLDAQADLPNVVSDMVVDGLIIDELRPPDWLEEALARFNIPAIWMNQKLPADCVTPADVDGAAELVDRLAELGHRRILFVSEQGKHFSNTERRKGYRQAMRRRKLKPRLLAPPDQPGESERLLRRELTGRQAVTAVICNAHSYLYDILAVVRDLELSMPENISLVQIGNTDRPRWLGRTIDCLPFPAETIAAAMIEEFLAKRAEPNVRRKTVLVPLGPYVKEGTVGPANR
jgi:LacI family transcriptional regulator